MGALIDRLKLSQSVYGKDIVDYYKSNTIFMMDNYSKSSKRVCRLHPKRPL